MKVGVVLVGALLLVVSAAAQAQVCDGALAVQVQDRGLALVAQVVRPLVPTQIEIPALDKVVVDWPLTSNDARVVTSAMKADIELIDLQLHLVDGELQVQGKANVTTGGLVDVYNPYLGMGSESCVADVKVLGLQLDVRLAVSTAPGQVKLALSKALVTLDTDNSTIALKACGLGTILTAVIDLLTTYFMDTIEAKVEEIAKEKIPALVEEKLDGTLQISTQVDAFTITGALGQVSTVADRLEATVGVGVSLANPQLPACLAGAAAPAPAACVGAKAYLLGDSGAMFGAALSEAIVNETLEAAWRSGKLCISSAAITSPTLSQGMQDMALTLGMPRGTKLSFALRMLAPPRLSFTAAKGVTLTLNQLLVQLAISPPAGPDNVVLLSADLTVGVKPWVDAAANSVALDLTQVTFDRLELPGRDSRAGSRRRSSSPPRRSVRRSGGRARGMRSGRTSGRFPRRE